MPTPCAMTASAGLIGLDQASLSRFPDIADVLSTCERALAAAKQVGPGTLRVFVPRAAAA